MEVIRTEGYQQLLEQISNVFTEGRTKAMQSVNVHLIETYWQVGQHIVEFEQAAEYGKALINNLAADFGLRHGKGFSRSNLIYMRLLYLRYPVFDILIGVLPHFWWRWEPTLRVPSGAAG